MIIEYGVVVFAIWITCSHLCLSRLIIPKKVKSLKKFDVEQKIGSWLRRCEKKVTNCEYWHRRSLDFCVCPWITQGKSSRGKFVSSRSFLSSRSGTQEFLTTQDTVASLDENRSSKVLHPRQLTVVSVDDNRDIMGLFTSEGALMNLAILTEVAFVLYTNIDIF